MGGGGMADRRPPRAACAAGPGGGDRQTQRDLLPLPRIIGEFGLQDRSLSRAVRQRVQKRQRVFEKVNDMIDALNVLAGKPGGCPLPPSGPQVEAIARLEAAVRGTKLPELLVSPEEAARALLGSDRPYDGGAKANLGSYDPERISVPAVGAHPVDLAARLPDDARHFLVDFQEHILLIRRNGGRCARRRRTARYTTTRC
jgi:hypothetical protein